MTMKEGRDMSIHKLVWLIAFQAIFLVPASSAYGRNIHSDSQEYRFQESWLGPDGVSSDFIWYVMRCKSNGFCGLAIEGYQISVVVGMRVEKVANVSKFIYVYGPEDNFGYHFKSGDVLFELRQRGDGLPVTEWKSLTPTLDKNLHPGIYFQKAEVDSRPAR